MRFQVMEVEEAEDAKGSVPRNKSSAGEVAQRKWPQVRDQGPRDQQ
jgi:hypothetical protein